MRFIGKLLLNTLAIVLTASILPGIHVDDPFRAFLVALLLAVLNVTIKPLLIIFTIPITIFTFGFFLLVINAMMILLAELLISGFTVDGFWWALIFSIILTIINGLLEMLVFSATRRRRDQDQF